MRRYLSSIVLAMLLIITCVSVFHGAGDVYVSQTGGGSGTSCASPRAGSSLLAGDWIAGNIIHICGTWTGAANQSPFITALGSGTAGNPITVKFESGALMQAAYFSSSAGGVAAGAITLGTGRSWLTIDGNSLAGTIQNNANGSSLHFQQASTGVSAFNCNNCVIKDLNVSNIYVNVQGNGTFGDNNTLRAIDMSGPIVTISGNKVHDCGWCINTAYGNGDTLYQIYNNEVYNFGHAFAFATAVAGAGAPNLIWHDNYMHDTTNWDGYIPPAAPSCPFHQDGIHLFGTPTSTMGNLYMYNNKYGGNWGVCATGFVFLEGTSAGTPARAHNIYYYNNVHIPQTGTGYVNSNGWVGLFGTDGGANTTLVANNTFIGQNIANEKCFNIREPGLIFEDNVIVKCGTNANINISGVTGPFIFDYNYYGQQTGFNAFVYNNGSGDQFLGTFAAWKAATGQEAHSAQNNNNALLNTDGSETSTSPTIKWGANLGSLATALNAPLALTTSAGLTATPVARPATATCTTQGASPCWDIGAFQYGASGPLITISPSPVAFGNVNVSTPSAPITVTIANIGGSTETLSTPHYTKTGSNPNDFNRTGGSCTDNLPIPAGSSCTDVFSCTPLAVGARSATLNIAGTVNATASMTCSGTSAPIPVVTLGPRTVNYGSITTGTSSAATTYTLQNSGTATLNITAIASSDVTHYPITAQLCGATLPAGNSCTFAIAFTPITVATFNATVSVTTNASTSVDTIALTGVGVTPPTTPAPAPVIFIGSYLPIQPIVGNVTLSGDCNLNARCTYVMACAQCSSLTQLYIDKVQVAQTYSAGTMTFSAKLAAGTHPYLAVNLY